MPFGASIVEITCWRAYLWQHLQSTGYTNIDFVGSLSSSTQCGSPTIDYDRHHEGHSGFLAIDIANKEQLPGWLKANPAKIITMHLGTNDIRAGYGTKDILAAYSTLIDQMRASNPAMKIIVAQIIPMPSNNSAIMDLNAGIPAWAVSKNSTNSPIWVVDQYTGFLSSDLRPDGIHPNDSGDHKMEAKWYPAMLRAIASLR
ncbi:carbohydrate esterase family 3 protein [Glonium stellatum]|uniref:Carbohydrate esterase family 3 protein n=1 Tax=Glonium stellatum TaxID=574774 RepID=A0A8E2JXQ0_9PEZI|nr:carbohydrate esterase family 3 protein [Glonium stellatum]